MYCKKPGHCDGFTLVELLIALALLAVVVTPLLTLFSSSACVVNSAALNTTALNLAREKIEQYKVLTPEELSTALKTGAAISEESVPGYPGFKRCVTLAPYTLTGSGLSLPAASEKSTLLSLCVAVSWVERDRERSEAVCTLLCLPTTGP